MQTTPAGLCTSAHSQILIVVGSGFVHLHSFPGFESGTRGKGTCLSIVVHVVRKLMIANGEVTVDCQPEAATRGSEYTGGSDGAVSGTDRSGGGGRRLEKAEEKPPGVKLHYQARAPIQRVIPRSFGGAAYMAFAHACR